MYILVDEKNVVVATSTAEITENENGWIVDNVLYLDKKLSVFQTTAVTADDIQKKCFCRQYQNCFGEVCPHYDECYSSGSNTAVYTNKSYSGFEVIEEYDELPTIVTVGDVIKCGDKIFIGEEI